MSTTLDVLVRKGIVQRFEPDLGPRRLPMRELFVTSGFVAWANSLSISGQTGSRLVSPTAELSETAAMFVAGDKVVTVMRGIMPTKHGVVRLFTTSFALLGWADGPQRLVLSRGITKAGSHQKGRLDQLRKDVVAERTSLGLNWDGRPFHELFCYQG
jgi:hypothetical protein